MSINLVLCGCGGEVKTFHDTSSDYPQHWSWCVDCQQCDMSTGWFRKEEEAIAAWNRAMKPQIDDAMVERAARAIETEIMKAKILNKDDLRFGQEAKAALTAALEG